MGTRRADDGVLELTLIKVTWLLTKKFIGNNNGQ